MVPGRLGKENIYWSTTCQAYLPFFVVSFCSQLGLKRSLKLSTAIDSRQESSKRSYGFLHLQGNRAPVGQSWWGFLFFSAPTPGNPAAPQWQQWPGRHLKCSGRRTRSQTIGPMTPGVWGAGVPVGLRSVYIASLLRRDTDTVMGRHIGAR